MRRKFLQMTNAPIDWDSLHRFLAGIPLQALLNLAMRKGMLELEMRKIAQILERQLQPDSQEAWDAAVADGEMEDRAQMTAGWLRSQHPQAWERIKEVALRLSQGNLTEADLSRIDGNPNLSAETPEEIAEAWSEWAMDEADHR
ncbi:MAG: hypothetical protein KDK99_11995 [Verrucomicrobiales bacterium]|nr:hypothetical protein [Verrucomicrobiales bacterium]